MEGIYLDHLDSLQKMLRGEVPAPPIAQLLGFNMVELDKGMAVFEMETSERLYNPMGTLHGGILCDISDAAMGCAFATTLEENESYTTIDIKLNFLKPVWKTNLRAVGKLIKRGNTIGLLECHVYDEKESLISHSTCTCMVLRDDKSEGR